MQPLWIPVEFFPVDAENFVEKRGVFGQSAGRGSVKPTQFPDILAFNVNSKNSRVVIFTISEQTGSRKGVAYFRADKFNIKKPAQMPVEIKNLGIQEKTLISVLIYDINIRVVRKHGAYQIALF